MTIEYDNLVAKSEQFSAEREPDAIVGKCPNKPWTINVEVHSKVPLYPKKVRVWLYPLSARRQFSDVWQTMTSPRAPTTTFQDNGPATYMARTSTGHDSWTFAEQRVEVKGGDEKTVVLRIEPKVWVGVRVVDSDAVPPVEGAVVEDIIANLKLVLPDAATKARATRVGANADEPVSDDIIKLAKPGSTTVSEVELEGVWEFVEVTSS